MLEQFERHSREVVTRRRSTIAKAREGPHLEAMHRDGQNRRVIAVIRRVASPRGQVGRAACGPGRRAEMWRAPGGVTRPDDIDDEVGSSRTATAVGARPAILDLSLNGSPHGAGQIVASSRRCGKISVVDIWRDRSGAHGDRADSGRHPCDVSDNVRTRLSRPFSRHRRTDRAAGLVVTCRTALAKARR